MNDEQLHVVLTGGGTGGHLFPGLAVAEQLRLLDATMRITIATGSKSFERNQTLLAGLEHLPLPSHPLARGAAGAWAFVKENLTGYRTARRFLRMQNVALVVGLGGYASVPMAWAAASNRVPLVLLEQNAVPGRAMRWLAPRASLVCAAFETVRPYLRSGGPVRITGNPIRSGFSSGAKSVRAAAGAERQLLVLGGSGGSRTLNEQVPRALYKLGTALNGWRVAHQTGPRDCESTAALYRKLGVQAIVAPFIERIQPALQGADLVISRAGGTTLAELAAAGVPAVLVPYPHAAGDHQRKNADLFVAPGAARLIDPREVAGRFDTAMAEALADLLLDPYRRQSMSDHMQALAKPYAAWHVATMVHQLAEAARDRRLARKIA